MVNYRRSFRFTGPSGHCSGELRTIDCISNWNAGKESLDSSGRILRVSVRHQQLVLIVVSHSKLSRKGAFTIARQVNCVCGRRFHIGHGKAGIQCRDCGRWWSGREISWLQAVLTLICGGEIAGSRKKQGVRQSPSGRSHKGRQTNRRRPGSSPLASIVRFFLG